MSEEILRETLPEEIDESPAASDSQLWLRSLTVNDLFIFFSKCFAAALLLGALVGIGVGIIAFVVARVH